MKNRIQRILVLMLAGIFLFTAGCGKNELSGESTSDTSDTTQASTVTSTDRELTVLPPPESDLNDDNARSGDTTEGTTKDMVKVLTLPLYTLNMDTLEKEAVSVLIEATEITPELIVDKVIETLEDQGLMVKVESVTTLDDAVVVSFYNRHPPLTFGSSVEGSVLDVFAQSLVDNLEDYSKVIYRIEGEAYMSGHFEFGINEVYLEDTSR